MGVFRIVIGCTSTVTVPIVTAVALAVGGDDESGGGVLASFTRFPIISLFLGPPFVAEAATTKSDAFDEFGSWSVDCTGNFIANFHSPRMLNANLNHLVAVDTDGLL